MFEINCGGDGTAAAVSTVRIRRVAAKGEMSMPAVQSQLQATAPANRVTPYYDLNDCVSRPRTQ